MSVPEFINLGQEIRSVFYYNFLDRGVQLELNSATDEPGLNRTTFGMNLSRYYGRSYGSLRLGYDLLSYGTTITGKWTMPDELYSQVRVKGVPLERATMWFSTKWSLPFSFLWSGNKFNVHGAVNLDGDPIIRTGGVYAYRRWVLGGQLVYNVARNTLAGINGGFDGNTIAFGYSDFNYSIYAHCSRCFEQFGFSYHNSAGRRLELAGKIGWDRPTQVTTFAMAAISHRFQRIRGSWLQYTLKAKIDHNGQMGLSAALYPGEDLCVMLGSNTGLLTGLRTTFGLGIFYGKGGPGDRASDSYNCCT